MKPVHHSGQVVHWSSESAQHTPAIHHCWEKYVEIRTNCKTCNYSQHLHITSIHVCVHKEGSYGHPTSASTGMLQYTWTIHCEVRWLKHIPYCITFLHACRTCVVQYINLCFPCLLVLHVHVHVGWHALTVWVLLLLFHRLLESPSQVLMSRVGGFLWKAVHQSINGVSFLQEYRWQYPLLPLLITPMRWLDVV